MFDNITDEMLSSLSAGNLEKLNYIESMIKKGGVVPPLVIRRFSDLSFSLAIESLETGVEIEIAKPLLDAFNRLLDSSQISIETKTKMKSVISDTRLDFLYANGKHGIASLRLAPFIKAEKSIKPLN